MRSLVLTLLAFAIRFATTLDGRHVYLSTGCLHGDHEYCASKTGKAGQKKPAQCKFCDAECVCPCHRRGRQ